MLEAIAEPIKKLLTPESPIDPDVPVGEQVRMKPLAENRDTAKKHLDEAAARYLRALNITDPHRAIHLKDTPSELERLQAEAELPELKRLHRLAEIAHRKACEEYAEAAREVRAKLIQLWQPRRRAANQALYARLDEIIPAHDHVLAVEAEFRRICGVTEADVAVSQHISATWPEFINEPMRQGGLLEHRRGLLQREGLL